MTKEDIINYVMHTPFNTNPAVLHSMLEEISGSGEFTVLEAQDGWFYGDGYSEVWLPDGYAIEPVEGKSFIILDETYIIKGTDSVQGGSNFYCLKIDNKWYAISNDTLYNFQQQIYVDESEEYPGVYVDFIWASQANLIHYKIAPINIDASTMLATLQSGYCIEPNNIQEEQLIDYTWALQDQTGRIYTPMFINSDSNDIIPEIYIDINNSNCWGWYYEWSYSGAIFYIAHELASGQQPQGDRITDPLHQLYVMER